MRRSRSKKFSRDLCAENVLLKSDFIYPVFLLEDSKDCVEIFSMPGVFRYGIDALLSHLEPLVKAGLPAVALFPVIEGSQKDFEGSYALNEQGLIPAAILKIKKNFPELGVITDIALDPYTSHGQDGVIDENGYVLNDETIELLIKQALCYAHAGADVVAPSDMMDGRIGKIRNALEENGLPLVQILAYSAKYSSHYYGPFRDAVGSSQNLAFGGKDTYQMACGNLEEALLEAQLDFDEGADFLMIKPAQPYQDVIKMVADATSIPVFAYQVSGEYAQLIAAIKEGFLSDKCIYESCLGIKRSGARAIFSYFTPYIYKHFL